jgi:CRISPR-associated endonuclease Csn1
MEIALAQAGVLPEAHLSKFHAAGHGHPAPWWLAARWLAGKTSALSAEEFWQVLRWYAHHRGYDANRSWLNEDEKADSQRTQETKDKMATAGVKTAAEHLCKLAGCKPGDTKPKFGNPFRGAEHSVLFARSTIEEEVRRLVDAHVGKLKGLDAKLRETLVGKGDEAWASTPWFAGKRLPKRYKGSLLFGQLIPRFDNRIISACPFEPEPKNKQVGRKVPCKATWEFLNFRWAMVAANIRISFGGLMRALTADETRKFFEVCWDEGDIKATTGANKIQKNSEKLRLLLGRAGVSISAGDNLDQLVVLPDSLKAFRLVPISSGLKAFRQLWSCANQHQRRWLRSKLLSRDILTASGVFKIGKPMFTDWRRNAEAKGLFQGKDSELLNEEITGDVPQGRASYSRPMLIKAFEEVMAGRDPREDKGCLFRQGETSLEAGIPLDRRTNNHLVRHRIRIAGKLRKDIISEYAEGDPHAFGDVVIEINRDLPSLSGKNAQEIAAAETLKLKNFNDIKEKLEKDLAGHRVKITAGLIRKARIASDLDWTCPFTGQKFSALELVRGVYDKEHIVPRSVRLSDSLASLVITPRKVNDFKGKRTGLQFVREEAGKKVPDTTLSVVTEERYRDWVEKLSPPLKTKDDIRRCEIRKRLLLTAHLPKEEEVGFLPRDLTQTSYLAKLALREIRKAFENEGVKINVQALPGLATATARKAWKLMGCLAPAFPEAKEALENNDKQAIRKLTHLHHALDAVTLALSGEILPRDGKVLAALAARNKDKSIQALLKKKMGSLVRLTEDRAEVEDLPKALKEAISKRLAECRVAQHIPATWSGTKSELTMWGVVKRENGRVTLRQRGADGYKEEEIREDAIIEAPSLPGAFIVSENYGILLGDPPEMVPWKRPHRRLKGVKGFKILRKGSLIQAGGSYVGIWRVASIKRLSSGTFMIDLIRPAAIQLKNKQPSISRINVLLTTLIRSGLRILQRQLTGCPSIS